MGQVIMIWVLPIGAAVWWRVESGSNAALVATVATLVWLTIWGIALRDRPTGDES
jgi:hypothetical protein